MATSKFQKRFLLFTIGQLLLILGTFTIASNFKVLPSWLSLFVVFTLFGLILMYIAFITFYKINRNFLRAFIAFIIYLIITVFADACAKSKEDFYLIWSRGLEISANFVLCASYVYFFFGTHDFFHETNQTIGKKKTYACAISVIVMFVIQQIMSFIASLSVTKQNLVFYSICRFGSWGLSIIIDIFIFIALLTAYIIMKKKNKEESNNEETK